MDKFGHILNFLHNNFYINITDKELLWFFKSSEKINLDFINYVNDEYVYNLIIEDINYYDFDKPVKSLALNMYSRDIGYFYIFFLLYIRKNVEKIKSYLIKYYEEIFSYKYNYDNELVELFRPNFLVANKGMLFKYIKRAQKNMLVVSKATRIHVGVLSEVMKYLDKDEILNDPSGILAEKIAQSDIMLACLFIVHVAYSSELMVSKRNLYK